MKKIIFMLIIIPLLFVGCLNDSDSLTINKGILKIGINIDYPPMEYYADDGITPAGFNISPGKATTQKIGLEIQFLDQSWDEIFEDGTMLRLSREYFNGMDLVTSVRQ
jgi:ABC-type amino acid transport substrate-binding protein